MPEYLLELTRADAHTRAIDLSNILKGCCWCLKPYKDFDSVILSTNTPLPKEAIQRLDEYGKAAGFLLYETMN
ncbi:MAG: hypothetical protein NT129_03245 [Candidatus Aenigmarchaeota archaeon]|nr:hypothetical protein [Candidatus Aenigmarchaeota archaeon]